MPAIDVSLTRRGHSSRLPHNLVVDIEEERNKKGDDYHSLSWVEFILFQVSKARAVF